MSIISNKINSNRLRYFTPMVIRNQARHTQYRQIQRGIRPCRQDHESLQVTPDTYKKLLNENITAKYKKANATIMTEEQIASKLDLQRRIEQYAEIFL